MSRPPDPHQPDDLGYEVVDDPGYEVVDNPPPARKVAPPPAKAIPAAKVLPARPLPAARVAPRVVAPDPGFEVVDDPPAPKAKPKSAARVVHDAETVEVPRSKAKTTRVRVIDDEDDRDDRRDDEDRPKKRKKKRRFDAAAAGKPGEDGANSALMEWIGPAFMIVIGLVLTMIGTYGLAKGPDAAVTPVVAVVIRVVGEMISIPLTIVALMVIGSLFGIEYGTFVHAVRSLAAMGFLVGGLIDILDWAGLPFFAYQPIIFAIGLGLFMTLLRLDVWEAIVTMVGLNLLSGVFQFVALLIILGMASKSMNKDDFDDGPGRGKAKTGQVADDDDFGPPPGNPFDPDDP